MIIVLLQAYDSVFRPGLFAKLNDMGFGGRTLSIIKSMYHNDALTFYLNGKFSRKIWLTAGVKQGTIHKLGTLKD